MPKFFKFIDAEGTETIAGPFNTDEEAAVCRDALAADFPDGILEDTFEADKHYRNALPCPQAAYPQDDGSTLEVWSDGLTKTLLEE